MITQSMHGVTIYYDSTEKEAGKQLGEATARSIETITKSWMLPVPAECRVYLMVSWPRCVFQGAPLGSQILLGISMPLWYREFKLRWQYAGGWSQGYGTRQVVGIKTPRLIADTPVGMGDNLFIQEEDLEQKFLSVVCHELTHAFSSHLELPGWLNEGLAMVSVDRCLGKQTVDDRTLVMLTNGENAAAPADRINMKSQSREQIILLYARGYWLTRYLAEKDPELIRQILAEIRPGRDLEAWIAAHLEISQDGFWQAVGPMLVDHFNRNLRSS